MNAHFVDVDCLLALGGMAWVVDKSIPSVPIIKISRHDFNLYKSGVYRSQGNRVDFNGVSFWLPSDVFGRLKVKLKGSAARLGNLAISMQEFMNRELVENMPYSLDEDMVRELRNRAEDIYLVVSRQTERAYASHLDKMEKDLSAQGISLKGRYHLSESFHNQTDDLLLFRRARLFVQHLVGYRTEDDRFVDKQVAKYDKITAYDRSRSIVLVRDEVNPVLRSLLGRTDEGLARVVREEVEDGRPTLELVWLTGNEVNRRVAERVHLDHSVVIRQFESFVPR